MDRPDEILHSGALGRENSTPKSGQAVVAAPDIVQLRYRPVFSRLYEVRVDKAFDGPVQCRRPKPDLLIRPFQHILHDSVSMLVVFGESQ